jgi:Flp pilus assembly protein TadD
MAPRGPIPVFVLTVLFCCSAYSCFAALDSRESTRDQRILQIQQLIEDHDLAGARRLLAEAQKQFPADPGFDNLRGVVDAQSGNYAAAESSFKRAVDLDAKFTGAYLNLGRLYQENSAVDPQARRKALNTYSRVLAYDAGNTEANYQSAALLLQQKEYQSSLNHLLRLPVDTQSSAQALSVLCADFAGLKDRKHTEEAAARLSAADLAELDIQQMLPALEAGGRDDLVVSLIQSLQARQPLSPELTRVLGLAYERGGKLAEARAALEQSVTKENISVPLLLELARVAHKQRDYKGSLGYLAHAEDLEPNNASLYYYFGFVCLDLNLIAEARNSFEKAVKLDPENPSYNYAMGAASAFRHDPAEAVPYFQKYLKLKPQDPRGKLALAAALFRAKDYAAAEPWLKEAIKIPQTATTAHYYLGCIALQERRFPEARQELEQALKARPDYPDALAELGQYYLMQKDYRQAEKQLRSALDIDPDHYTANFYLLNLYTRTNDARRAAQAKRFEELQKLLDEKTREFLRIVEVRPFEVP